MSMGHGISAIMIDEDEKTVIYAYNSYNLNIPEFSDVDHVKDGIIMVEKSCFIEPIIREKIKKMPSGRKKKITKKILVEVRYAEYLKNGLIKVENCSNSWDIIGGYDRMALRFIYELFRAYQKDENIPQKLGIFY